MGVAGIWHGMFGAHVPVNNNAQYGGQYGQNSMQNRPVNPNGTSIMGTVSSINGTTIIIQALQRPDPTLATTTSVDFTVDASNARIIKSGSTTTATVANIGVGDRVIAQGTVDGNSITARLIIDTLPPEQIQKPATKAPAKNPVKAPTKVTKPSSTKTPVKK